MADKVFTMRIEETLLEKLRESAERNKRSIAKEIEFILENSLEHPEIQSLVYRILKEHAKQAVLKGKTSLDEID